MATEVGWISSRWTRPLRAVTLTLAVASLAPLPLGCGGEPEPPHDDHDGHDGHDGHDDHGEEAGDARGITAWGGGYEVFAELAPLVAGETAGAHTHVTVLDGFEPLARGGVEVVLRGGAGEEVFRGGEPERPGVFDIALAPREGAAGETFELVFRVRGPAGEEEIPAGRLRVGSREEPGGPVSVPTPRGATLPAEPATFTKEQQWTSDFATRWVRGGSLPRSVRGLARVRPPAGGEAIVTAPVEGVLEPRPWPYPGETVGRGKPLFRVVPRVAADRSLPDLGAEVEAAEAELDTARARLERLRRLYEVEATSRREVEEAEARVRTAEARLEARRRDRADATALREGRGAAAAHAVRSPLTGEVVTVDASPGASVAAGERLARVVETGAVWVELELPPEAARGLAGGGSKDLAGLVVDSAEGLPLSVPAERLRLVSVAPEVDPERGTVRVLVEAAEPALLLGTTVQASLLLAEEREGIVVPATALVDDAGTWVVYLQIAGERFVRQPVEIVERQGERVLVEGLVAGQRLVTRGGGAIRRSVLMSASGDAHGHAH